MDTTIISLMLLTNNTTIASDFMVKYVHDFSGLAIATAESQFLP